MTLHEKLSRLRAQRWDLMEWLAKSYPNASGRRKAQDRLTIITAQVLSTEAKLYRSAKNVERR